MRIIKIFLFLGITFFFMETMYAQNKTTTGTPKFKPPKLTTSLGPLKDTIVNIPVQQAEIVIGLPLKIYDAKKVEYTVSSYNFLYRKKVVTEDEQTGKVSPASSMTSNIFKTTPLPGIWVNTIKEQVKSGEELFFFDVIAKDPQGRVMYAPNLKIHVQ